MPTAYATKVAEGFSKKLLKEMYDKNLSGEFVNRDYEGEINEVGSKLNILAIDRISEKTYSGSPLTADNLYEKNTQLVIDQYKSFYWKEKTIDRWKSYIKNPHSTVVVQKASERNKNMDQYIFGFYGDVGAGNRVGTDYITGTVTVDAVTGVVTGAGTTFTSAMVGRGFKAVGHSTWYRVKAFSSTTSITIEDDLDDSTSAYTGGAIAGGTAYVIEAATPIAITTSNLLAQFSYLKLKLDKAESYGFNAVPDEDRVLVVPPEFESLIVRAQGVALHVPAVYNDLVKKGFIGELLGFKIFRSNRLTGNNTDGYRILGGHTSWMTFAEKLLQSTIEEVLIGDFGQAYKDLFVYGAKVPDTRRHMMGEVYATFTL